MNCWKSLASLGVAVSLSSLLISCASVVPLQPGAENVKVAVGSVPKGCQFRGDVGTKNRDIYGSSHRLIQESQLNVLKNQAAKLDANAVFITKHRTKYEDQYIVSTGESVSELHSHEMDGKAYQCSSSALNKLLMQDSSEVKISDLRQRN